MKRISIDRSGNKYCGPLAFAALAGLDTTKAAAEILRGATGRTTIKGLYTSELVKALRLRGHRVVPMLVDKPMRTKECFGHTYHSEEGPTLATWLRTRPDKNGTYLVTLTGHFCVVSGRKFIDTHTRGEWVFLSKAPRRRKRVQQVHQIA